MSSVPAKPAPVRVVLVDDSRVVKRALEQLLAREPGLEVVGTAADGAEGLHVRFRFPGVVPQELAVKPIALGIDFETDWFDARAPFEHVKLRTDDEGVGEVLEAAGTPGQFGITASFLIRQRHGDADQAIGTQMPG